MVPAGFTLPPIDAINKGGDLLAPGLQVGMCGTILAVLSISYAQDSQSINLYSPIQLQANNKKVWQAARTGNSPTKLATLDRKTR